MNNIKALRGTESQESFVKRLNISYIRAPELSKIESGIFDPTPCVAQRISDTLGKPLSVVFPDLIVSPEYEAKPNCDLANNPVLPYIRVGRSNAVSRESLCSLVSLSDRKVRKCIEQARREGEIIVSLDKGYYISDDLDEIAIFYHQEYARAISTLSRLTVIRRMLDSRQISGQMVFRQCIRCGEPIDGDGELCGECEKKVGEI
jgi:biotin operon repressor